MLLLERDDEVIRRVQRALEARGYIKVGVEKVYAEKVVERVRRERPHLILMGVHLADPDDLALMEALRNTPSPLMALVDLSGGEVPPWGLLEYALKPLDMEELIHNIEVILHVEGFPTSGRGLSRRALVIGGGDGVSTDIQAWAAQWHYTLERVEEDREGVRQAQKVHPEVILIDEEGLSIETRAVCRALHGHPSTSSIPVVVIGGKGAYGDLENLSNVMCVQRPVDPLRLMKIVGWMSSRMQDPPLAILGMSAFIEGEQGRADGT